MWRQRWRRWLRQSRDGVSPADFACDCDQRVPSRLSVSLTGPVHGQGDISKPAVWRAAVAARSSGRRSSTVDRFVHRSSFDSRTLLSKRAGATVSASHMLMKQCSSPIWHARKQRAHTSYFIRPLRRCAARHRTTSLVYLQTQWVMRAGAPGRYAA